MRSTAQPLALIVEDEALIALLVEDLLAAEGFDTVLAADQAEAIARAIAGERPSVAVVDLHLDENFAGQRVIHALRQFAPDLPVVVMTGYKQDAPEADLRGLGWPTARLVKPAGFDGLVAAVWDVIDQARTGRRPPNGRRASDQSKRA